MTINPFSNLQNFETAHKMAAYLSGSSMVPEAFQNEKYGKQAVANCLIAMEMASRLGIGMLECFQNIAIIYGRPTFSAAFMIARLNNSGLIRGKLRWAGKRDENGNVVSMYAYATDAKTGEELRGQTITLEMAEKAGWKKRSQHWDYMPEQMMRYRAASFFIRAYYPDVILGLRTQDEVLDAGAPITVSMSENELNEALAGEQKPAKVVMADDTAVIDITPLPDSDVTYEDEVAATSKPAPAPKVDSAPEKPVEKKPKRSPEEIEIAEKGKQALNLYKEFFGRGDLALAEMVQVTGKSDARNWTLDDVTKLHKHLKGLREAKSAEASAAETNGESPVPDFPFGAPEPTETPPADETQAAAAEDAAFV